MKRKVRVGGKKALGGMRKVWVDRVRDELVVNFW